jgi:large subunit ribosomal protein L25
LSVHVLSLGSGSSGNALLISAPGCNLLVDCGLGVRTIAAGMKSLGLDWGSLSGVLITHELNEVEVSCLPKDLPEFIEVDLSALDVGDIVHLSNIQLPNGVEIPELKLGKEHDVAVVIAKLAKEEVVETPAADAAAVPATTAKAAPAAAKPAAAPAKPAPKK